MARGISAALAATATAAASHTLAGAETPAPAILALAAAFAAVVCVLLSGRQLSLPRLTASVLLSQIAYHGLFLVTGSGGEVSVIGTTGSAAHFHDGSTIELITGGGGHAAHGPVMLVAHLVAAGLTIAALRHAERLFWTLGATLHRVVVRIVARASALALPQSPSVAVTGAPEPRAPRTLGTVLSVLSVLRHRGPPLRAFCAA
ncbi:hypothetical protein [Rathayibacter rathayi]|uniref:Integral membrane protein n=1 Tax=Rathayibacter rathayi TaxID=33887 RepID=A0ABX5AD99_RATRA|nr:hypothetical protein [Rathayibacter rathayi]PPF26009.1 hypothetical protein C5C34_00775 [Rathayibacter rathayi]PPG95423.1 hypothetical protein C5C22_05990 [Rathayibacter rathayi]PPH36798.1 hypothetical protein C5C28_05290 [Rathayibacter rathayi]PPH77402.1 hypothetical protein C5C40_07030 [Rathayibacter rathayi]PPI64769.1 hypothetical protein C5E02_00805 [Rathayibacter rathayi]